MPVLMILGGFGFMIGTGGSALVAKTLGEGESGRANRKRYLRENRIYWTLIRKNHCRMLLTVYHIPLSFSQAAEDCDSDAQNKPNLLKKSYWITGIAGIAMMLLSQGLSPALAGIFVGYDRELFDLTVHAFRLFAFSFLLAGANILTHTIPPFQSI